MSEIDQSKLSFVRTRLAKIQDKIQDKLDDFQESVQTKYHLGDKLAHKLVSHVTQTQNEGVIGNVWSYDTKNNTVQCKDFAMDSKPVRPERNRTSGNGNTNLSPWKCSRNMAFDKTDRLSMSHGEILKSNLRLSHSTSNLKEFNEEDKSEKRFDCSSDSCFSCSSSHDERSIPAVRPRSGSLPPEAELSPSLLQNPCELLERLGHRFPKLKEQGDRVQRYFLRNSRLSDVNKRLKAQIWSSVVTIVLVEAKNLPAMDLDTGSSDPYVKFRLGNEKYKSKVVWKSLHPTWLEQFDLHLYDDQEHILEVTLWDKDKQTKDDFLGRCTIDLSTLEREKTHSIWRELEDNTGQIFLLLTISGTTQSETITDLTAYQENPRDRENVEKRYAWYRMNESAACGVGWLCVKVYSAKGLAAADLGGKSDPFCVLELGNARLQTHTEYKTLTPNWMKIFTFTIKDITSILEVTVYDEDHDHKVEFLGKLCVPLLSIRSGEKRWYALKDKKMRARAKGNSPQILLEMYTIWNPITASLRAVNPKEEKFMQLEAKFKRQLFIRNVMRLKIIVMWFLEVGKVLQNCFEWESRVCSFSALLAWLVFCYNFQSWMVPFLILVLFTRNFLIFWLTGGNPLLQPVDDEDILAEEDEEDGEADKEEKKSLKERLQAIQEVTQTVQNAIGYIATLGESVKNLVNFTVPYLSYLAILMLLAGIFVLYLIPVRYLLMAWGINKFTRKILRPHSIPNNEVLDLLSRVPDDETLLDCRELKLGVTHHEARRDLRKKHKAA